MESYEQLKYLVQRLRTCAGEQYRAQDRLMRIAFDEQAMKPRFFQKQKWPPFLNRTNWKQIRKALLRNSALKELYLTANRQKLIELLSIQVPEELSNRQLMFEGQIEALPDIISKKTVLTSSTEQNLDTETSVRIFVPLALRGNLIHDCIGCESRAINYIASSFGECIKKRSNTNSRLHFQSIRKAEYFAEPSNLSTEERAVVGYRDEIYDRTKIDLSIRLSRNTFYMIDQLSEEWLSKASEDNKKTALLSIDVPNDIHLTQRDLEDGEGKDFRPIKSSDNVITLMHLHLCNGIETPIQSFSIYEELDDKKYPVR